MDGQGGSSPRVARLWLAPRGQPQATRSLAQKPDLTQTIGQTLGERTRIQCRLRWLLHDRWPELELPTGCLDRMVWLDRLAGRLARSSQDADVRVMRDQLRRLKELTRRAASIERELLLLVRGLQPRLLA